MKFQMQILSNRAAPPDRPARRLTVTWDEGWFLSWGPGLPAPCHHQRHGSRPRTETSPSLQGLLPQESMALGPGLPTPCLDSVLFPLPVRGAASLSGVSTHLSFLQEAHPDPAHRTSRTSLTCPSLPRKPGTSPLTIATPPPPSSLAPGTQ